MCWTSQVQTAFWIWTCRCGRSICWQLRVRRRRCAIRSSRMPSAASTHAEVVKRVRQSRSSSRKSRKAEAIQSQQEQAKAPEPAVDRRAENALGLSEGQAKANGAAGAPAVKVPEPAEPPLPEAEPEPDARPIASVATDTPAGTETPRRHRHRGSGDSASSAVAIAKRQLTELAAHGLKAEPHKVVSALRKEFPQGELIENLTHWLDHFLAEMRKAATESTTSATENAQKPATSSEPRGHGAPS